jgi:cytochrome c biogenesis protein CcmG, thiol:disulfide interchange protein DsbE
VRILAAILICALALVRPASGDDRLPTLKVGDITYSNVLVLRVSATDLFFSSPSGITNVKLTDLDPAVQAQFAPDAAKTAAAEQTQSQINSEYLRAAALQTPAPPPDSQAGSAPSEGDSSKTNSSPPKTFLNQTAPDLAVEKWISAAPSTAGKLVLLDFWAPTNEPSKKFLATLNEFQEKFSTNLAIIAISDQSEEDVRAALDTNIQYSVAIDSEGRMAKEINISDLPYSLVADTNLIVRWEGNPLSATNGLSESVLSGLIEKYVAPSEPAAPAAPAANP